MQANQKLPVVQTLVAATNKIWEERIALSSAIFPLAAAYYLLVTIASWLQFEVLVWFSVALSIAFFAIGAINTHRIVLLGNTSVPRFGFRRWSGRETRFFGWLVAIYFLSWFVSLLPMMLVGGLISVLPDSISDMPVAIMLLGLAALSPYFYFLARFSLLFPSAALDHRNDLAWAWKTTQGNGIRLILVSTLPSLAIWLTDALFELLPTEVNLLYFLILPVFLVFEIIVLSLCYQFFTGHTDHAV